MTPTTDPSNNVYPEQVGIRRKGPSVIRNKAWGEVSCVRKTLYTHEAWYGKCGSDRDIEFEIYEMNDGFGGFTIISKDKTKMWLPRGWGKNLVDIDQRIKQKQSRWNVTRTDSDWDTSDFKLSPDGQYSEFLYAQGYYWHSPG